MNLFLLYVFTFLDLVPPQPVTIPMNQTVDPITKIIAVGVLILFLAFIGYLIWKSIRDKRKDD